MVSNRRHNLHNLIYGGADDLMPTRPYPHIDNVNKKDQKVQTMSYLIKF